MNGSWIEPANDATAEPTISAVSTAKAATSTRRAQRAAFLLPPVDLGLLEGAQRGVRVVGLPERQRGPLLGGVGSSGCRLRLVLGCFPCSLTGGQLLQ
jgi:hypothetical protein